MSNAKADEQFLVVTPAGWHEQQKATEFRELLSRLAPTADVYTERPNVTLYVGFHQSVLAGDLRWAIKRGQEVVARELTAYAFKDKS